MKNILHISDIHTSEIPTKGMTEYALKALLASLKEDLKALPKVDTIFITGDISNSGRPSEYSCFLEAFLNPLMIELGVDSSRVIITPGNHDSNRKEWKKSDQLVRSGLMADPQQSSIEEILREKIEDTTCKWMAGFTSMRDGLDIEHKNRILANKFFSAYEVDGVGIGCINSAWLANEKDKEALFVSEWQFKEIINALKPFSQRVILMHHPLDWLHPSDKKILMSHIHSSKISCLFYGHMHEFWMAKESVFSEDSVLKLQAGRLDTIGDNKYCGYSLVALHEKNTFESGDIYFRNFDSKTAKFRPWNERINTGRASFSLTDSLPFDPERFCICCSLIASEIEFDLLCNTGLQNDQRKKLSQIFVLPTLVIENNEGLIEDSFEPEHRSNLPNQYGSLNSLYNSPESLIILGGENSGKSTLAKRLSLHFLSKQSSQNFENIVFYVDLKERAFKNTKQICHALLSFYLKDGYEPSFQTKIERKLNSAGAVIIFDSIECIEPKSLKTLFEFISTCPARILIFGQLSARPVLRDFSSRASNLKKFSYLNIKSLNRNNLKELVSKWNPDATLPKTSKVASSALKIVSSTGMANNPFVFSMLLSIRERKSSSYRTYMHEADLVENFIEIIMQKHVIPSGNVPQYKDVLLFLGYIANHMHKNSSYAITENELTQKAIDFNKLIIQDFKVGSYIEPIFRSGILRQIDGGRYKFSQICFFNYALAYWISKQSVTYESLDQQLDFIRFDKVIEYVSALKNDSTLLDFLSSKVNSAWDVLKSDERLSDLEDAEREIIKCVGHDIIDLVKQESLASSFSCDRSSEEEHDRKLDQEDPLSDEPCTEVKNAPQDTNPIVTFHEALSLYARSFRSAEHILDTNATHMHLAKIFQHYMNSIAFNVRIFDVDARPIIIEKIKSILQYERIDEGKRGEIEAQVNALINFMIVVIPNWGVAMMSSDFFNQRQRPRMEIYRDRAENNLEKILLTYCLCELDDVNVFAELNSQKYVKCHESSSLILKLFELIFLNFGISDNEKANLKKLADKMINDRKTNKLFRNYTAVSKKIANSVEVLTDSLN